MTDLRTALERHHRSTTVWDGGKDKEMKGSKPYCPIDGQPWPCDASRALAALDEVRLGRLPVTVKEGTEVKKIVCFLRGHKVDGPWSLRRGLDPTVYICCTRCWHEISMRGPQWPA
jgi:hypothetical protein